MLTPTLTEKVVDCFEEIRGIQCFLKYQNLTLADALRFRMHVFHEVSRSSGRHRSFGSCIPNYVPC